jgi:hypothetical protein
MTFSQTVCIKTAIKSYSSAHSHELYLGKAYTYGIYPERVSKE